MVGAVPLRSTPATTSSVDDPDRRRLAAGAYYLVGRGGAGAGNGVPLPAPPTPPASIAHGRHRRRGPAHQHHGRLRDPRRPRRRGGPHRGQPSATARRHHLRGRGNAGANLTNSTSAAAHRRGRRHRQQPRRLHAQAAPTPKRRDRVAAAATVHRARSPRSRATASNAAKLGFTRHHHGRGDRALHRPAASTASTCRPRAPAARTDPTPDASDAIFVTSAPPASADPGRRRHRQRRRPGQGVQRPDRDRHDGDRRLGRRRRCGDGHRPAHRRPAGHRLRPAGTTCLTGAALAAVQEALRGRALAALRRHHRHRRVRRLGLRRRRLGDHGFEQHVRRDRPGGPLDRPARRPDRGRRRAGRDRRRRAHGVQQGPPAGPRRRLEHHLLEHRRHRS